MVDTVAYLFNQWPQTQLQIMYFTIIQQFLSKAMVDCNVRMWRLFFQRKSNCEIQFYKDEYFSWFIKILLLQIILVKISMNNLKALLLHTKTVRGTTFTFIVSLHKHLCKQ